MDELNTYIAPSNTKLCAERSTIYDYYISGLKKGDEIKEYYLQGLSQIIESGVKFSETYV